ncbi:unnamed protein product [Ascophyllum nodosum]
MLVGGMERNEVGFRAEHQDLLPRRSLDRGRRDTHGRGIPAAHRQTSQRGPGLARQHEAYTYDAVWKDADATIASISRDLAAKAERWKLLAWEPIKRVNGASSGEHSLHAELSTPFLDHGVSRHEVAAMYVNDALGGRENAGWAHDKTSVKALKLVRNKAWNQVLNVCTIFHLALPVIEIQRCLPCFGPQKLVYPWGVDSLHFGWRPTALGSMWLECLLCCLYTYDLYKVYLSSGSHVEKHAGARMSNGWENNEEIKGRPWRCFWTGLSPWQMARTCMVFILTAGLLANLIAHYMFRRTWHRWSRVMLPFLFISRRTYMKLFVGGMIRVLPGMVPVVFLISFVLFFYAFLGYVLYRAEPRDPEFLNDLGLFTEPLSSALTFLRIYMSIPFMMDLEMIYQKKGVQVMSLSYVVIIVIFMGALVPAVANRNFRNQSKESYEWMNEQRKLALTRAYLLLRNPIDSTVCKKDWIQLMAFLRPDCDKGWASALFNNAKKAEEKLDHRNLAPDRLSKGGFFMLCALGKARFSKPVHTNIVAPLHLDSEDTRAVWRRIRKAWKRMRKGLQVAYAWCIPGTSFPLNRLVFAIAVVTQGYQIVREGDDPEYSPPWTYYLGEWLIAFFCVYSCLRMIIEGPVKYLKSMKNALDMVLNIVGIAFYTGFWLDGEGSRRVYHIVQASRLMVLWSVLYRLNPITADVAKRLELVFPAVLRSSFVLFAVTYCYALMAYTMYCDTPIGIRPLGESADHSMMKRWAFYQNVTSFATLEDSFTAMMDIFMLSGWPIFLDAAGDVGNTTLANIFFYSFKGITFYFVMPVMLGFIVQAFMATKIPEEEPNPSLIRRSSSNRLTSANSNRLTSANSLSSFQGRDMSGKLGDTKLPPAARDALVRQDGSSRSVLGRTLGDIPDDGVDGDDALDEEDSDNVVMVTDRYRSMSTTFWGAEQATASQRSEDVTSVQGMLARLEAENSRLRSELKIANCRLLEEVQLPSPRGASSSPRWASRRGSTGTAVSWEYEHVAPKFSLPPEANSSRKRAGSTSSITMEAIVESRDEEVGSV